MDFDKNQFLQNVFEALIKAPGDPVRQLDHVVLRVIAAHTVILNRLAQEHRTEILDMAEEYRRAGKPVATKWRV